MYTIRPFLLLLLSLLLLGLIVSRAGKGAEPVDAPPDLSGYPWLYLRDDIPPAPGAGATLLAVGDVMVGRGVLAEPDPFADVSGWLQTADLLLGNLEGVIADLVNSSPPSGYDLRMPPTAVAQLHAAGFDVMGLANNHSLDLGPTGLEQTAAQLTAAGLIVIGAGPDRETAVQPTLFTINNTRLALLAFNAIPDPAGQDAIFLPGLTRADWELETAAPLLTRIRPAPQRIGFACHRTGAEVICQPTEVPQDLQTGLFWSGTIDLTGDGMVELVRREGEQIVIYSESVQVWRGLPEWRVVDLALGDTTDDGRLEAILALWKEDEDGIPHNHPFIIGHRGGQYTLLWGGSAVAFPIHELELGNVTGDGVDNLVVLEETAEGQQRTISVWRWHGWGYTLLWRSPPGPYRDLVLLPGTAGQPAIISVALLP